MHVFEQAGHKQELRLNTIKQKRRRGPNPTPYNTPKSVTPH